MGAELVALPLVEVGVVEPHAAAQQRPDADRCPWPAIVLPPPLGPIRPSAWPAFSSKVTSLDEHACPCPARRR